MSEALIKATAELLDGQPMRAMGPEDDSRLRGEWTTDLLRSPKGEVLCHRGSGWKFIAPERLSLDLSIPAVRDRVVRALAERLGLECGATAPGWEFIPANHGRPSKWVLRVGDPEFDGWYFCTEVTDHAHALALAWRAVEDKADD